MLAEYASPSMAIVGALILADLFGAPVGPMVDSLVVTACKKVRAFKVRAFKVRASLPAELLE